MLTVKHIHLSGREEIVLTRRASYQPEGVPHSTVGNPSEPEDMRCCLIEDFDGSTTRIFGGTVFVMNDLGKTVSRYDLGASMASMDHNPIGAPTA